MAERMNLNGVALMISLAFSSPSYAYNSSDVGRGAGKYFGTAVAVDYFFEKSGCPNFRFGMRSKNSSVQGFVFNDINKLLSPADRVEFRRVRDPSFIKNLQNQGGEHFLRVYKSNKKKNEKSACRDTQNYMFGFFTSGISDFYAAATR